MYDPPNVKEQVQTKTRKLEILRKKPRSSKETLPYEMLKNWQSHLHTCTPSLAERRVLPTLPSFSSYWGCNPGPWSLQAHTLLLSYTPAPNLFYKINIILVKNWY